MNKSVFPVMICTYTDDNKVDLNAVDALVQWYYDCGCEGIFTACLSTEIQHLTLEERILVTDRVVKKANEIASNGGRKMTIVASGHVSDDFDEQVKEITSIHATGVDAVILISNRFDIANTSEDKWIEDLKKLMNAIPKDITLGAYESPYPYKRLLTDKMLEFIASTKRFAFIKDTCCDAEEIAKRVKILEGSGCAIYNANAQTLLQTLPLNFHIGESLYHTCINHIF
jgi:4-hydroxy-tetrahydrodipicolinate synthase